MRRSKEVAGHGEGGGGDGALDTREEEELARLLKATIGGASGLEQCAVVRRTWWRDELVNGSAVVMISPIEIMAAVMEQSREKEEMTDFSL
jgi:hypothetical protein